MGMRSILKLMLGAAGLLATILLLAVGAVYFFFDPNEFRDELALELSEATGRDVRFEGDLSLSVFPRLAISTEDVSVGNAPAFGPEPMLRWCSARYVASVRGPPPGANEARPGI